ncbi:MAG: hypothetical protein M4579_006607 [Chaenotheca gracillima]|nr:MAG: hypothetical protein M4579_006607 [Chaenotheca gracillima]
MAAISPKYLLNGTDLGVIAVGFSGGQCKPGVDAAPTALIESGLLTQLSEDLGYTLHHDNKVHSYKEIMPESDPDFRGMKRPLAVSAVTQQLSKQVYEHASQGRCVLTLGGDHSIAIGSIAGTAKAIRERHAGREMAVIWVDAHADINTPEVSDSGNIHGMPVAFLTGLAREKREDIFGWLKDENLISVKKLVYIGLRDVDRAEKKILRENGIRAFSMHDIDKYGIGRVMEMALGHIGNDTPIHLSFDVDALDPVVAPSTGTPVRGGLTLREGDFIAESVHETGSLIAMDLVEVNPIEEPGVEGIGAKETLRSRESGSKAIGNRKVSYHQHEQRQPHQLSSTRLPLPRPSSRSASTRTDVRRKDDGRERVVILGAGWGGYVLAQHLDTRKYEPMIISPRSYFTFTPMLASASTGRVELGAATESVRSRRTTSLGYCQGWADDIDFNAKTVTVEEAVRDPRSANALTDARRRGITGAAQDKGVAQEKDGKGQLFDVEFDKLIIAVGCYTQTFGTKGVKENAIFLKDVGDARRIKKRILECFETAYLPTTSDDLRRQLLHFAIVGGGPTGIEFSAELFDLVKNDLAKIYPSLKPFVKLTVYDVAPKILSMFDQSLSTYVRKKIEREGIDIKTEHHVLELRKGIPKKEAEESAIRDDAGVLTLTTKEEGEVGVGMVVWSTGLMMNPFVEQTLSKSWTPRTESMISSGPSDAASGEWSFKKDAKSGSIITDDRLRVNLVPAQSGKEGEQEGTESKRSMRDVFALGDCAMLEGITLPATAQVADQKAKWLAKRLNKGDIDSQKFSYKNLGVLTYIGNTDAVLETGGKREVKGMDLVESSLYFNGA